MSDFNPFRARPAKVEEVAHCLRDESASFDKDGLYILGPSAMVEVAYGELSVLCPVRHGIEQYFEPYYSVPVARALSDPAFETFTEDKNSEADGSIKGSERIEMARALGDLADYWRREFDRLTYTNGQMGLDLSKLHELGAKSNSLLAITNGYILQSPCLDHGNHRLASEYYPDIQHRNLVKLAFMHGANNTQFEVFLEESYVTIGGERLFVGFEIAITNKLAETTVFMGNDGRLRIVASDSVTYYKGDSFPHFATLHAREDDVESVATITDAETYRGITRVLRGLNDVIRD